MCPHQAVTSLVSKGNKSLSDYTVSGWLLPHLKHKENIQFLEFSENRWLHRRERPKSSVSSAALMGSRGLTPKRGLWGARWSARQSCRTFGASSSWWHYLVCNPALSSKHFSEVGLPPPLPPVRRGAVSVRHTGCHVHAKPPSPGALLSPLTPSDLLHQRGARSVWAGIAVHLLVWSGEVPFATQLASAAHLQQPAELVWAEEGCRRVCTGPLERCPVALFSNNVNFAACFSAQCQGLDEVPRCCTV